MADKTKEKKNPLVSLIGGLVMTIILVIVVPVVVSFFIQPVVSDAIGDTTLVGLSSGAIGAIVMFIVLVLFMLLLGGGAILRRFGIIGVIGLIIAYVWMGQTWGWVLPVIIVALLGGFSYLRDRKKGKK
ncbi:MAG: hypothetical protein FWF07_00450 [Methanomassiliicoccaceae archaeon]|nr:hypothetical protein [Methanomassiliicoccaceae archaeon]